MRKRLKLTFYRLGMTRPDGRTFYTEFIYRTHAAAAAAAAFQRAEQPDWLVWVEERTDR